VREALGLLALAAQFAVRLLSGQTAENLNQNP